jgi:hypothetical protein
MFLHPFWLAAMNAGRKLVTPARSLFVAFYARASVPAPASQQTVKACYDRATMPATVIRPEFVAVSDRAAEGAS